MRSILDNSSCSLITLETEIKTITMYLQLEAMRFSNKFCYSVNADPEIDLEHVKLPPMIIQPFIENAILHGIQHKHESGTININFGLREDFLLCTIEDDGVGRQKASEIEKTYNSALKPESHGIRITKERLNLLSKKKSKTFIEINDRLDANNNVAGTKVEIGIPILS
jgi:LytS/YehU family sensor histidine kinase